MAVWIARRLAPLAIAFTLRHAWLAAGGLFVLFQWLPRYASPGWFGIIRPSLLLVPLLWIPVGVLFWRRRHGDRIAHVLAYYALGAGAVALLDAVFGRGHQQVRHDGALRRFRDSACTCCSA